MSFFLCLVFVISYLIMQSGDTSLSSPIPSFYIAMYKNKSHDELVQRIWDVEQETYQLRDTVYNFLEKNPAAERFFSLISQKLFSNNTPSICATSDDYEEEHRMVSYDYEPPAKFLNSELFTPDNNNILSPTMSPENSPGKSYSAAVKTKNKKVTSVEEQVFIARIAIREEAERPKRESSVILTTSDNSVFASSKLIAQVVRPIRELAGIKKVVTCDPLSGATISVNLNSKDDATKFLQSFTKLKIQKPSEYGKIRARPNFSKTELALYRKLWAEAIRRNNDLESYSWTVKNFRLIKLEQCKPWVKRSEDPKPKSRKHLDSEGACSIA